MNLLCPHCNRFLCQMKEAITSATLRFPCPACAHHTTFQFAGGQLVSTLCVVKGNARQALRLQQKISAESDFDRLRGTAEEVRLALLGLKRSLLLLEPAIADMSILHTITRRRHQAREEALSRLAAIEQRATAARARILAYVEKLPLQCNPEALALLEELQQGWPRVLAALAMARGEVENNASLFTSVAILDLPGWHGESVRVIEIFPLHSEKRLANAVA